MNSKLKDSLRFTTFLLLFCLLFSYTTEVISPKWTGKDNTNSRISTFYSQPKDSIDVLFVGASSFRNGISPLRIWEKYGFTSYTRASAVQAPVVTYYYIVEALKYQHPKVVVIDGVALSKYYDMDENEGFVRIATDPMRLSAEKIQLISEIVSSSEIQTLSSYLFPLLRYHTRWKEIVQNDFEFYKTDNYDYLKGAYSDYRIVPLEKPKNYMQPSNKIAEYDETSLYYYEKIIQLCKENDIEIVFVTLPRFSWTYSMYIGIQQLSTKHDLLYLDYTLPEHLDTIGLDASSDFCYENHLNVYGAQKISKHLGAYLQETFDLPDKRNDPKYNQWNIDLQIFNNQLIQEEINRLTEEKTEK